MDEVLSQTLMTERANERITATVLAETPRLRAFVRRQVADLGEVEDIVQETFSELVTAYRLPDPVEQVAAWLYRVARNRIIDRFRARARQPRQVHLPAGDEANGAGGGLIDEWFATDLAGPEAEYVRAALACELEDAVAELPREQREVFVAHELEGRSFKDLAGSTGIPINTLLSRKHAAVQQLRRRLRALYDELDQ
jgi:RNA polymerase sigma factor (sigma-70 family)